MQKTLKDELQELISLTREHLEHDFERSDRIITTKASYDAYLSFAMQNPKGKAKPKPIVQQPIIKKTPPPPPAPRPKSKPPEKMEETKVVEKKVELQKSDVSSTADFSEVRTLVKKHFPQQKIVDQPLKENSQKKSLTPVVLVIDQNGDRTFLNHYTQAINICLGPARLINAKDSKLSELMKTAKLLVTHEKIEQESLQTLTLEPIEQYSKNPSLKAKLWEETKRLFQQSSA